ncbi:MAG: nucleoside-triphosphatase [Candidatus Marinimicrobia bacterium]|nr:nucleoside-triphosphatase [Candidatus Neomarinimicrobiota bacterium]
MIQLLKSRRLWLASLTIAGVIFLKEAPFVISTGIVILALRFDPATLRPLKNFRFWLIVSFLVILVPIFTGVSDAQFLGIAYSSVQFDSMILMALRGIDVFLVFQILSTNLNSDKARQLFQKLGISHFDLLFSISKETLPRIRSVLKARAHQLHHPDGNHLQLGQIISYAAAVIQDMVTMAESYSTEPESVTSETPQSVLVELLTDPTPKLLIISGDPGAGKTPWIVTFLKNLQDAGFPAGGIISEKVTKSNGRWFHQLRRVEDGSVMELNTMEVIETPIQVGKFYFFPEALNWGVDALLKALSKEWIIIDEIGHLEFQKSGFFPALNEIDEHYSGHLVFTVRSSLLSELDVFLKEHLSNIAQRERRIVTLASPLSILNEI